VCLRCAVLHITADVELMYLIGKEFQVGGARMRGVKYCDHCLRPSNLIGKGDFKKTFHDRGGLIAEIIESGSIITDDLVILPSKG
jgi:MOSC domain-containing protein YiiM